MFITFLLKTNLSGHDINLNRYSIVNQATHTDSTMKNGSL
jgi:hypothetical protein